MSQTLFWFKQPLVRKILTTDTRPPLFRNGPEDTLAEARRKVIVWNFAHTAVLRLQTLREPTAGL